jgi:hypothetical protein
MAPPVPLLLSLLAAAAVPQPNVRLGRVGPQPITPADLRRKPGRRLQRNGLLFHPGEMGCDPRSWPHVVEPGGQREHRFMVSRPASCLADRTAPARTALRC